MKTLRTALALLGYDEEKSKSLVQIFHIVGIFDGKTHDRQLTEAKLQEKLQSNLGLREDADDLAIAQEFNRLGQEKFKEIRGGGERQEMRAISIHNAELMRFFEAMQIFQEVSPPHDVRLYFIFGASEDSLRNRIGFLKEKLDTEGKDIFFLGGDRKLWPKYTGDSEYLARAIPGENVTFEVMAELNENFDREGFKKKVNEFFEEKKQDFVSGGANMVAIRKEIVEEVGRGFKWPTESDLERYLAREMLGIKDAKVIEGEIDPKIGRPTTDTTLQAIPKELSHIIKFQPKACFVSSQPYINRQTTLARSLSGLVDAVGCGSASSLDSKNIALMLEATLGEVNSLCLCKIREKDLGALSSSRVANVSQKSEYRQ